MEFRTEPGDNGSPISVDDALVVVGPAKIELPRRVSEALTDPIVRALMAADRIDATAFEELLRRAVAWLAERKQETRSTRPYRTEGSAKSAIAASLPKFAKSMVFAVALVAGGFGATRSAAADETAVGFIRELGAQAVSVIRSAEPLSEKADYFDRMIHQDFDLTSICRFELGPYWRVSSPAQRQQFCDGFADRLVHFYGRQLVQSGNGDFVVTGSRTSPDGVTVTSQIIRPQAVPIAVNWRLGISDGHYKIEDVAIDGVSMALAERWREAQ